MIKNFLKKYLISKQSMKKNRGFVVNYNKTPQQVVDMDFIQSLSGEENRTHAIEQFFIMQLVRAVKKIPGHIVEVGTFAGRTMKVILETEKDKRVYGFDTFDGLPELTEKDGAGRLSKGKFGVSLEMVEDYLKSYPNKILVKGIFPESGGVIKNEKFSLVNIDVDLYEGTLKSLGFFYPRISKGGVMVIHDYISLPGVKSAVDEFFSDKPEAVIYHGGASQAFAIKL